MADNSKIEWTDATWQIVTGCDIESPGCKNCYAMKLAGTRLRNHPSRAGLTKESAAGPVWTGEVRFNAQWLKQPLDWKRGRLIFPAAHGDLFHPAVEDTWLDLIFAVMAITSKRHTYQCLTKRPARAAQYLRALMTEAGRRRIDAAARTLGHTLDFNGLLLLQVPVVNVMIGASVEDQRYADARLPAMREVADMGWRTWVSYEPALGPVDWAGWEFLTWMVSGGESGPSARPTHADWHRATRDFCARNRIAYHFKQWGAWLPWSQFSDAGVDDPPEQTRFETREHVDGEWREAGRPGYWESMDGLIDDEQCVGRVGKKAAGRLLDGRTHDGFPGGAVMDDRLFLLRRRLWQLRSLTRRLHLLRTRGRCLECGSTLTPNERHYYGSNCERCEGIAHHALHEELQRANARHVAAYLDMVRGKADAAIAASRPHGGDAGGTQ